ncbi:hypothetical protein QR680_010028 [Steinernema hermaphroditum]|uniref:Uncharacterized protein n=1 Tax=Steinernema hermaphroditum TaxID=289476 RepID=A0AA39IMH1_9BILA|nr:hypothetical protein QR680_010028 [Steinernema hermaphroditum]
MFMRPLYPTLYQNHSCHDTSHIASFFMRIMNGCRRIEAILSVALALERFQAVFALKKLRYLVDLVRQKFVIKTLKIEVHEKSILVQAFVRFFGDTTMTVFYHIVPLFLPHSKLLEIVTTLGYLINNLVLPPVLSVIVSRTLRTDVFLFMLKVSTVQPS